MPWLRQGFRVLGLAIRPGGEELREMKAQDLEQELVFVGLVAMFDPPRPEVKDAITQCHQAGIRVTMVTGDYGLTAEAIAQQIGLLEDPSTTPTNPCESSPEKAWAASLTRSCSRL
jgi:magnesium-transporting ATPase (P-type)